jgi:aspartyl-tRNA(Asn)/glutamyl-tRNA(Gln) amidotransferase subunit A
MGRLRRGDVRRRVVVVGNEYVTVRGAADLLAARTVSAVELVEEMFRRMETTEPLVHAYATTFEEEALRDASRSDRERARGVSRGPLHGVPFAVKDVFYTRGTLTEAGSRVLAGFRPADDATAVERLRRAGAVLLGKLVTHEFACGQNAPPTRNAWNTKHRPGGSSAGAGVAVAVGSTLAALGTDAGGSVRKPAALNGVVGLKPTYGRVSKYGVLPPHSSLDVVGVVTRTVEDSALILQAIAGRDERDRKTTSNTVPDYARELQKSVAGMRLGIAGYFFGSELDPGVAGPVDAALKVLERCGVRLVHVALPALELALRVGKTIFLSEAAAYHRRWLREKPALYEFETRHILEVGLLIPAVHLVAANEARARICNEVEAVFRTAQLDGLVSPTLPLPSADIAEVTGKDLARFLPYVFPANLTGQPAISTPCGFTADGSPVGLQVIGRPLGEASVMQIAHAFQQVTNWHRYRPPISR